MQSLVWKTANWDFTVSFETANSFSVSWLPEWITINLLDIVSLELYSLWKKVWIFKWWVDVFSIEDNVITVEYPIPANKYKEFEETDEFILVTNIPK